MATPATHIWKPSSARILQLDSFVPVPRGSTAVALPPLSWPAKDPADVLDFLFDISQAFAGNEGDAIASLDVTITPSALGDLVLQSATADGSFVVLWLSGGQAGTTYTITLSIITTNGRAVQRSIYLPVLSLSTLPATASTLLTGGNGVLTDQNGNPILLVPPS